MAVLAINGGPRACEHEWPKWPISGQEERDALLGVLDSGKWWYGEKVQKFEQEFADFQGAKYGITCSSGTTALEVALLALGIGAGDEVIVPPLTFMATASAVLRVNAIPIFADVDAGNICLDPEDVERKITPKTKAIIPVHFLGYVTDMDRLNEVAKRHGLFVVEDACHSWGSQWKGKGTGALGDCGVFSFQESKNITSGEGGIILTDDENLADMCRSYTNCGRGKDRPWYEHYVLGSNLRLTEFQAALLSAQLTRLEDQTLTRMRNAAILETELKKIPGVTVFREEPRMTRRAYHMYPFRVKVPDHAGFAKALAAEGVRAGLPYPHPLYKNPLFLEKGQGAKFCPISCPYYGKEVDYSKDCCPVCEELLGDMIWIWHTTLLVGEQAALDMAKAVKKVMENLSEIPSNA